MLVLSGIAGLDGFDLQCGFGNIIWKYMTGLGCSASNVNIVSRNQSIVTSVNGQNLNSFSGSNYLMIAIYSPTAHFVPQNLGNFFPAITGLAILNSKLKDVQKKDISQLPKLKQLYLYGNDLQSLPADLFEANLDLEIISFERNKLLHVGQGILTPLKKLQWASFNPNPCINVSGWSESQMLSVVEAFNAGCRNDTIDQMHKNKICVNCGEQKGKDNPKTKMEEKLRQQDASML